MKRVIVTYEKLNTAILDLLVAEYPDGYNDDDIIRFKNQKNELIEAVEVKTEDTIYLVKISTKLEQTMEDYAEDEMTFDNNLDYDDFKSDEFQSQVEDIRRQYKINLI